MAKSEKLMPMILKWEGGYSHQPYDKGGCTMKGITIKTYQDFFGKSKTCSDLKNIENNEWLEIFENGYWNPLMGNDILNQSIANIIVDWGWMSGVKTVAKKIQKLVKVKVDGIFGKNTISAINSMNQEMLFNMIYNERKNFYYNICKKDPSQERFLKGWLNRLDDYHFEEETLPEEKKNNEEIKENVYENPKKTWIDYISEFGDVYISKCLWHN